MSRSSQAHKQTLYRERKWPILGLGKRDITPNCQTGLGHGRDIVASLARDRARAAEILAQSKAEGMTTLVQDGIVKSLQGVTDLAQVRAVAIK